MKKILIFSILCSIILCSCQKKGIDAFQGDYSFKTSGTVTVQRQASILDTVTHAAYTFNLPNEIGQLNISTLDKHNDSVLVVLNYLNGEVIVTQGYCQGQAITLKSFQRNALNLNIDAQTSVKSPIKVRAEGTIYDDNTIVFDMTYRGKVSIGMLTYKVDSDDVRMVAYRN